MRLFACLVLTTVVASAAAQWVNWGRQSDTTDAQIDAVNALPNVDVQMVNETIRADDNTTETESGDFAVDPFSAIVNAVNETVETVAASLPKNETVSEDAPVFSEDEEEAVVVTESVQENPAPTNSTMEEMSDDEEPADVVEPLEEEDEPLEEEDEPMLQEVETETSAPETDISEIEPTMEFTTDSEPEPEPAPEDDPKLDVVTVEKVDVEPEEPRQPTKKELKQQQKAIEKFNAAVDNIVKILESRFTMRDALPLNVTDGTLEELDVEVTTLPPTTTTTTTVPPPTTEEPAPPAESKCKGAWPEKCKTESCLSKSKCLEKCKKKGCMTKKKNKNNKNNKNRKDEKNKKNNKKNKKNNKNKNKKNKKKNNNKRIGNRLFNRQSKDLDVDDVVHRQSKDLNLDVSAEQARRIGNKKQGKKGKRTNSNKSRLEPEAKLDYVPLSAEEGPLFASNEELLSSPAIFMGFSKLRRLGDVEVDLSGKNPRFIATIAMGPLDVHLTNPASQLKRTEVTTELTATMHFTAKTVRNRNKLKINEVVVQHPEIENVNVMRSDLVLEPEVVSVAQSQVSSGIDTQRVARIIHQDLAAAFNEDNILENLEDHPSLKIKHLY